MRERNLRKIEEDKVCHTHLLNFQEYVQDKTMLINCTNAQQNARTF